MDGLTKLITTFGDAPETLVDKCLKLECKEFIPGSDPVKFLRDFRDKCEWSSADPNDFCVKVIDAVLSDLDPEPCEGKRIRQEMLKRNGYR